jgi:hypothetical protein
MFSIRKFVGYGATVLGLGLIFALALAPHSGLAAPSGMAKASSTKHVQAEAAELKAAVLPKKAAAPRVAPKAVTPTAECPTARANLAAAKTKDVDEDTKEKASPTTTDKTLEDVTEKAAIKPFIDAVRAACGSLKPAPSTACLAAMTALKAADTDTAEKTSPLSADADKIEDAAEKAKLLPLLQQLRTACGFDFHR